MVALGVSLKGLQETGSVCRLGEGSVMSFRAMIADLNH
jgi:hypothetical protein